MDELKKEIIDELHAPARRRYPRRPVKMRGIDNHWQADLVDVSSIRKYNKNHRFILTVIDTFSKYSFARGLKTKKGEEVTAAMESIFNDSKRVCDLLETDRGTEFYNRTFQSMLKRRNIRHYSTYSEIKVIFFIFLDKNDFKSIYCTFSVQLLSALTAR